MSYILISFELLTHMYCSLRFERRSFARDIYSAGEKNRSDRDRDRELADSRFAERRER